MIPILQPPVTAQERDGTSQARGIAHRRVSERMSLLLFHTGTTRPGRSIRVGKNIWGPQDNSGGPDSEPSPWPNDLVQQLYDAFQAALAGMGLGSDTNFPADPVSAMAEYLAGSGQDGGDQSTTSTQSDSDTEAREPTLFESVLKGLSETLKTGNPFSGLTTGLGDVKFPSENELARRLGISRDEIHAVKDDIENAFPSEMKKLGTTNPDIGYDNTGNIVLRNPKTRQVIKTGVPLSAFGK